MYRILKCHQPVAVIILRTFLMEVQPLDEEDYRSLTD